MAHKKLIAKYRGRISKCKENIVFYSNSLEKNEAAKRIQVSREMKHIINKLESKIRIYNTVIEDLKQIKYEAKEINT